MLFAEKNTVKLTGKVALITGASSGVGKETALELSRRGAKVIMPCRNLKKAEEVREEIARETGGTLVVHKLDLSSLQSVRECAAKVKETEDKIDILVNNAGISCPNWKTVDGFDMAFGTNHLGHFLFTELLRPLIKNAATPSYRPRYESVRVSYCNWVHFSLICSLH